MHAPEQTEQTAPPEPAPADIQPTDAVAPSDAAARAEGAQEEPKPAAEGMSPAACGAKLAELFPALFVLPHAATPQTVKPLKLRIQADIQERAPGVFTKRILGIYFSRYTTSNAYLKVLTQAPSRFDLDGNAAGEIDIEHRTAAVQELARRREVAMAKRAEQARAERAAQAAASPAPPPENPGEAPAPRSDRPQRETERRHPPRPAHAGGEPVPRRAARPGPRPERAERSEHRPRADRPERSDRPDRAPQRTPRQEPHREVLAAREPEAVLPQDPAQRDRALLLRAFESSSLSKANFCALKRLSEADLDTQLAQARAEREAARGKRRPA